LGGGIDDDDAFGDSSSANNLRSMLSGLETFGQNPFGNGRGALSNVDVAKLASLPSAGIGALLKSNGVDPSIILPRQNYCPLAENVKTTCWTPSPLEMWNYDYDVISKLTDEEIIKAFNEIKIRYVFSSSLFVRNGKERTATTEVNTVSCCVAVTRATVSPLRDPELTY
jgi:hypothetical protein